MFNMNSIKSFMKRIKISKSIFTRNNILIAVAIVAILVTGVLILVKSNGKFSFPSIFGMSDKQIAERVISYINDNKLSNVPASLVSVSEESGLVKVKIKIGTQEFDSYATKDGKLLFPQAFDMSPKETKTTENKDTSANSNKASSTSLTKTDKPMLEAFIVARCPYGLQMQRMMADAVKNIPSLAQYVKVEYFGSISSDGKSLVSMHGDSEAKENLRQICIREEQSDKYWSYVACQMKSGDTAGCETSTGVDSSKLDACMSDSNKGIAYAKKDFAAADKYNVSGSPTLVLNSSNVSEFDYGGRTSDAVKSVVCAGFKTQPDFCSTKLNTSDAAASFSATYASTGNSGSTGANCQAAQ